MSIFDTLKKNEMRKPIKRLIILLEVALLVPILILLITNLAIRFSTEHLLYSDIHELPFNKVGLVLGTSPKMMDGRANPYFQYRMEAAAALYHSGKIRYLLVSGDNQSPYYNEPQQMKKSLESLGVPGYVIYKDRAGLRTLDSVIRAKKVFQQDSLTIISQRFHNQRATFIAKNKDMHVVGYNADDAPMNNQDRTRIREWLAKSIVFWDLLINKQPMHMEEPIMIGNGCKPST